MSSSNEAQKFFENLGKLKVNLLSLEFLIRGCLFKKEGQENTVPNLTKIQEGQLIPKNAFGLTPKNCTIVD